MLKEACRYDEDIGDRTKNLRFQWSMGSMLVWGALESRLLSLHSLRPLVLPLKHTHTERHSEAFLSLSLFHFDPKPTGDSVTGRAQIFGSDLVPQQPMSVSWKWGEVGGCVCWLCDSVTVCVCVCVCVLAVYALVSGGFWTMLQNCPMFCHGYVCVCVCVTWVYITVSLFILKG